jgi:hypothetical protein
MYAFHDALCTSSYTHVIAKGLTHAVCIARLAADGVLIDDDTILSEGLR